MIIGRGILQRDRRHAELAGTFFRSSPSRGAVGIRPGRRGSPPWHPSSTAWARHHRPDPFRASPSALAAASKMLLSTSLKRCPSAPQTGHLTGVIALADVAAAVADEIILAHPVEIGLRARSDFLGFSSTTCVIMPLSVDPIRSFATASSACILSRSMPAASRLPPKARMASIAPLGGCARRPNRRPCC